MKMSDRLVALTTRVNALSPSIVPMVAVDILTKAARYGDVTDRQHNYVCWLLAQAEGGPRSERSPREKLSIDLPRIVAMFDTAAAQLKRPKVHFLAGAIPFTVSKAPETGRNVGFLYVKQGNTYLGKISPDGRLSLVDQAEVIRTSIAVALAEFAANPQAAALAYGQETGDCCFCGVKLEDPVSVELGYGPICAKRWGLPHRHTGAGRLSCEEVA